LLNIRFPHKRSSYFPPNLIQKYVLSSYRGYRSGQFVNWYGNYYMPLSQTTRLDTYITVAKGDLIIVFQWVPANDNSGGTIPPTDNFGSVYKEVGGADVYLGGSFVCAGKNISVALGGVYYAIAAGSGDLIVTLGWQKPLDDNPCCAIYAFSGVGLSGDILYSYVSGQKNTGSSISITTHGLPDTACHYALIVVYMGINPCINQSFGYTLSNYQLTVERNETCIQVCSSPVITLSDAMLFGYYFSETDFTSQLQFLNVNTSQYGYFLVLV